MLVDTGSDNIVLPEYLREALGVSTDECHPVAAGTVHGLQMGLQCPGVKLSLSDYWETWEFEAPVVFAPYLNLRSYGLLGREPTLDYLSFRLGHDSGYGFVMQRLT